MSAALFCGTKLDEASPRLASVVRCIAAVASFPFDRVLSGMVAAGQGINAICLFLGLSREVLDENLVRLGLRTPHDRPMRKPGDKGWTPFDTMRLIAWRVAGIHPEVIGQRLNRSVGAVRAKARRLGIPAPNRKDLRRVDPATLRDPELGYFLSDNSTRFRAGATRSPNSGSTPPTLAVAPNPTWDLTSIPNVAALQTAAATTADTTASAEPLQPAAKQTAARLAAGKRQAQREMPFFGVVVSSADAKSAAKPSLAAPKSVAPGTTSELVPPAAMPLSFGNKPIGVTTAVAPAVSDIAWIGRTRRLASNQEAILALSMRYFGGQHPAYIARDAGMTEAALHGVLYRANLPRDRNRRKFSADFDPEMAAATLEASRYVLVRDKTGVGRETGKGHLFWKHERRDRNVRTNRAARFRNGILGEYDKYKGESITLLTRADLDDPDLELDLHCDDAPDRPFARIPCPRPFAERRATLHP